MPSCSPQLMQQKDALTMALGAVMHMSHSGLNTMDSNKCSKKAAQGIWNSSEDHNVLGKRINIKPPNMNMQIW